LRRSVRTPGDDRWRSGRGATYPAPVEADYIIRNFTFGTGEVLPELRIHYRTIGTPLRDATDEPSV